VPPLLQVASVSASTQRLLLGVQELLLLLGVQTPFWQLEPDWQGTST
jgi:hypothetical protein